MRQIGQRAAVGRRRPAGTPPAGSAAAVTKLLPSSITLMISAAVRSSFFVLRIRPAGASSVSVRVAADERHHRDAGLEPREPERELREQQERHRGHHQRVAVLREERRGPVREQARMPSDFLKATLDPATFTGRVARRSAWPGTARRLASALPTCAGCESSPA